MICKGLVTFVSSGEGNWKPGEEGAGGRPALVKSSVSLDLQTIQIGYLFQNK